MTTPHKTPNKIFDILFKIKRYLVARTKWIWYGKKLRNAETIAYIYDNICNNPDADNGCKHFTGHSCDICGCRIARTGTKFNKLAWATEKCPDDPPKWQ